MPTASQTLSTELKMTRQQARQKARDAAKYMRTRAIHNRIPGASRDWRDYFSPPFRLVSGDWATAKA